MTDKPSVVIVKDDEGLTHFTSPDSDLAKKYMKPDEEAADAAVDASASDDRDSDTPSSGSRNRRSGARIDDDAVRSAGPTQSESGS